MPPKLCKNPNDMPEAALDNWQPIWNALVLISPPMCVNYELRPDAGDIHICWFNFDALAQGNAYKPIKEPVNYHGPDGDWKRPGTESHHGANFLLTGGTTGLRCRQSNDNVGIMSTLLLVKKGVSSLTITSIAFSWINISILLVKPSRCHTFNMIETKLSQFRKRQFEMHFLELKCMNFA